MEVLHRVFRTFGPALEIVVFGCNPLERAFQELPWEPSWRAAGILTQQQVARLMNEADIFLDLSSHQAMGLTAMEAMACGAAVMVPLEGGAGSIVRDEYDGLVVDTSSGDACERSLSRLIEEHEFRTSLQERALADVVAHAPEGAAFRILSVLFGAGSSDRHADPKIDSRSV
jgi:glycosyltransferase involved in cell wall biosynthesis